jgi:D-hexose-6-phosphate mutarotase
MIDIPTAMQITARNLGTSVMPTTQALHTYFSVSNIDNISIVGLDDCSYHDNLDERRLKTPDTDIIKVSENIDRIYVDTGMQYMNRRLYLQLWRACLHARRIAQKLDFYPLLL